MDKQFIKKHGPNRREFIGKTGMGLLVGTAFNRGVGLAETNRTPDSDRYQSVSINTHEWNGDIAERLDLPKGWDVKTHHIAGYQSPILTKEDIRDRLQNPINALPLREIAAGKKTAVITFDDSSRATPSNEIAPVVVEELKAGGIKDENILFIAMVGSHRPLSQNEARAKLGGIVDKYPWINHNPHDNFVDRGLTTQGNHVKLNHYFMQADVKVTMSGIKKHGAGYSGGAKAILPGLSWINTITYMHEELKFGGLGNIHHNEVRACMEEAARKSDLDFSINTIMNENRRPIGMHAGDVVDAFRSAAKDAAGKYATEMGKDADVVIANSYPMSIQETGFGFANRSLKEGGTAVVIWQSPRAKASMHYWAERREFDGDSYWQNIDQKDPVQKAGKIILYSQYVQRRDTINYPDGRVTVARTWDDVLAMLEEEHTESTKAIIYPWAGYQHGPIEIDTL
jgi:lactate racemase